MFMILRNSYSAYSSVAFCPVFGKLKDFYNFPEIFPYKNLSLLIMSVVPFLVGITVSGVVTYSLFEKITDRRVLPYEKVQQDEIRKSIYTTVRSIKLIHSILIFFRD